MLPFFVYVFASGCAAQFPRAYPLAYPLAVALTAAVCWWLWRRKLPLEVHGRVGPGILVGIVGIGVWLGLSQLGWEEAIAAYLPSWLNPGGRPAYNPFAELPSPLTAWLFVAVRVTGLAILVPLVEELFWRGFLMRWLIREDWQTVPLGQFSWHSFLLVTFFFSLVHPEWFAAAAYCALLNGLLYWKRDLWTCIVAHSVSNLVLAGYILATGTWSLW